MKKILHKVLILILSCAYIVLLGCSQKIRVYPDKLLDAKVGQPYYAEIKITGGRVIYDRSSIEINGSKVSACSFYSNIEPANGLRIESIYSNNETVNQYNYLKIYGTPLEATNSLITIAGSTYGTMYPGRQFEKTYQLKVNE